MPKYVINPQTTKVGTGSDNASDYNSAFDPEWIGVTPIGAIGAYAGDMIWSPAATINEYISNSEVYIRLKNDTTSNVDNFAVGNILLACPGAGQTLVAGKTADAIEYMYVEAVAPALRPNQIKVVRAWGSLSGLTAKAFSAGSTLMKVGSTAGRYGFMWMDSASDTLKVVVTTVNAAGTGFLVDPFSTDAIRGSFGDPSGNGVKLIASVMATNSNVADRANSGRTGIVIDELGIQGLNNNVEGFSFSPDGSFKLGQLGAFKSGSFTSVANVYGALFHDTAHTLSEGLPIKITNSTHYNTPAGEKWHVSFGHFTLADDFWIKKYDGTYLAYSGDDTGNWTTNIEGETTPAHKLENGGAFDISGDLKIKTGGTLALESGGAMTLASGGTMTLDSGSTMDLNGSAINLNSGLITIDTGAKIQTDDYVAGVSGALFSAALVEASNIKARGQLISTVIKYLTTSAVDGDYLFSESGTLIADFNASAYEAEFDKYGTAWEDDKDYIVAKTGTNQYECTHVWNYNDHTGMCELQRCIRGGVKQLTVDIPAWHLDNMVGATFKYVNYGSAAHPIAELIDDFTVSAPVDLPAGSTNDVVIKFSYLDQWYAGQTIFLFDNTLKKCEFLELYSYNAATYTWTCHRNTNAWNVGATDYIPLDWKKGTTFTRYASVAGTKPIIKLSGGATPGITKITTDSHDYGDATPIAVGSVIPVMWEPAYAFVSGDTNQTQLMTNNTWYGITSTAIDDRNMNRITNADGILTVAEAGTYLCTADVCYGINVVGVFIRMAFSVGGATPSVGYMSQTPEYANDQKTMHLSNMFTFTAGQTLQVKFRVNNNSTTTITIDVVNITMTKITA